MTRFMAAQIAELDAHNQNTQLMTAACYSVSGEIWISTRRFCALPASVAFDAIGLVALGIDVLAAGERKDFGFPSPVTLDGYVLANLTARWQVTRSLALVGRIENLFDEQYELADTFNTPDRGVYVSVRYAPGRSDAGAVVASVARHPSQEQTWATD